MWFRKKLVQFVARFFAKRMPLLTQVNEAIIIQDKDYGNGIYFKTFQGKKVGHTYKDSYKGEHRISIDGGISTRDISPQMSATYIRLEDAIDTMKRFYEDRGYIVVRHGE